MPSVSDAKAMAKSLRSALAARGTQLTHSETLEIVAGQLGYRDWNVLAAELGPEPETEDVLFRRTIPILRIFDEEKAKEFYCGFLGFGLDWEHRFGENFPLYCQVSRAGLALHLSAHHGDATPGSNVFVTLSGVRSFQRELAATSYRYLKPGVEDLPWGLVMEVTDPFGNRIRFCEQPA